MNQSKTAPTMMSMKRVSLEIVRSIPRYIKQFSCLKVSRPQFVSIVETAKKFMTIHINLLGMSIAVEKV